MMSDNESSSIINGDSPLPIPRQFARWLGWNEAGILQQLHWHTEEEHGQVIDGVRWIRMSETEWMEEIPLDEKAIQRAIKNLVEDGLIMTAVFKGRCKWYAILYSAVADLTGPVERITQKSKKRKQASASRKNFTAKEHFVPIVINSMASAGHFVDGGSSVGYAQAKEHSVPISEWEQNGGLDGNKMGSEWEQNVPLQESLQDSFKNPVLILDAPAHEILDKIGSLCRTNFFNPNYEPYKASLLKTIQEFSPKRVLWAIELALSPEKANGKPKTWGFVLAILEKDKDGSYEARKNGESHYGHHSTSKTNAGIDPALEGGGTPTIAAQLTAAWLSKSRGGRDPT